MQKGDSPQMSKKQLIKQVQITAVNVKIFLSSSVFNIMLALRPEGLLWFSFPIRTSTRFTED